jgi:putative transposase
VRRHHAALPLLLRRHRLPFMAEWPHSPTHQLGPSGAYIVTSGTYQQQPIFCTAEHLEYSCETLLQLASTHGWKLEAWAIFPNHNHFVATCSERAETLREFVGHLHYITAKKINLEDRAGKCKVWFQYWESHLSYQRSYFARLNYVHTNAVRHGLVRKAEQYEWCSAGWFQRKAKKSFYHTVMRFPSNRVNVMDDYVVAPADIR